MKIPFKQRFMRYFQYLSNENAEKTFKKLYERLSVEQRIMHTELFTKNDIEKGITDIVYFPNKQVIVTLTTHSKRIYEVFLAIESIMQQTVKPNRIVLWLDETRQNEPLPITLQKQMERGLEVRYCKDVGPHTKLVPSLREFPNDILVTIDDDTLYAFDMLENLLNSYRQFPQYIHADRAHVITFTDKGRIDNYNAWEQCTAKIGTSPLLFPTGIGGVLYPPHSLCDEVLNEEAFLRLCPTADDIWLKAMSLLNNTPCYRIATHDPCYYSIPTMQDIGLYKKNVFAGENDIQIKKVFETYHLYDKLKSFI